MKDKRKKAVTLAELAKRLNLSSAAVSRALNDGPSTIRVSADTIERVRAAATELGYRPNRMARALRTGRSGMIGVIASGGMDHLTSQHLYYARQNSERMGLLPAIHEVASRSDDAFNLAVDMMLDAKVDGVVLIKTNSAVFERFAENQIPTVSISTPDLVGFPKFCSDGVSGMSQVTRHMLQRGCRDLVLLAPYSNDHLHKRTQWSVENGFEFAITESKQQGIEAVGRVHFVSVEFEGLNVKGVPQMHGLHAGGYVGMRQILDSGQLPDGVIGMTDHAARGALTACAEAGIKVPDDIAFAGYGDAPSSSAGYLPLTSVAHPLEGLHQRAFKDLETMIAKKEIYGDRLELLPCTLIVRRSSQRY